jgi:hypothetical protein
MFQKAIDSVYKGKLCSRLKLSPSPTIRADPVGTDNANATFIGAQAPGMFFLPAGGFWRYFIPAMWAKFSPKRRRIMAFIANFAANGRAAFATDQFHVNSLCL